MNIQTGLTHGIRKDEVWSCRVMLAICFALLLPVAIVARLSGWRWQPWPAGSNGYRSAIQEARMTAATLAGTAWSH